MPSGLAERSMGGGDDVLGKGVADGLQGAKLAVGRGVAVDDPCHLNIDALIGTGAYEVDFSCTQLSDGDGIAKVQKVVVNLLCIDNKNTARCGFVAYGQQNWTAPAGFLPVDVS